MSELVTLSSPLLAAQAGVRHAFFTRKGGVSRGLYASLNLGAGSNDAPDHVRENQGRAAMHFGIDANAFMTAYQIHSTRPITVERPTDGKAGTGDALVTAARGLAVAALAADCAPVLICDAQAGVVAAAHAGWRGALGGVVSAAVGAMRALGAEPSRMVAAVGPCIGPRSYEVGLEFLDRFEAEAPGSKRFFQAGAAPDKRLFDLPAFVLDQLDRAGVAASEWIGRDTYLEPELFYSNRQALHRGEADYGRLASAIMLTADI